MENALISSLVHFPFYTFALPAFSSCTYLRHRSIYIYIHTHTRTSHHPPLHAVRRIRIFLPEAFNHLRGFTSSPLQVSNLDAMSGGASSSAPSAARLRLLTDLKLMRQEPPEVRLEHTLHASECMYLTLLYYFVRDVLRRPCRRRISLCGAPPYSGRPRRPGRAAYTRSVSPSTTNIPRSRPASASRRRCSIPTSTPTAPSASTSSRTSGPPYTPSARFSPRFSRSSPTPTPPHPPTPRPLNYTTPILTRTTRKSAAAPRRAWNSLFIYKIYISIH